MNKTEYAAYEKSVAAFMKREGIENLSAISQDEPYFSWRNCDCCKRLEEGMREDCSGYNLTADKVQGPYTICEDCVYYAEYGRLDDTTMLQQ